MHGSYVMENNAMLLLLSLSTYYYKLELVSIVTSRLVMSYDVKTVYRSNRTRSSSALLRGRDRDRDCDTKINVEISDIIYIRARSYTSRFRETVSLLFRWLSFVKYRHVHVKTRLERDC